MESIPHNKLKKGRVYTIAELSPDDAYINPGNPWKPTTATFMGTYLNLSCLHFKNKAREWVFLTDDTFPIIKPKEYGKAIIK